ncbi:MAG TPA: GNVR domain-containing protein [Candidatus Limnocylindrales bacterium]|nr:GNVR domain-containing protein [Candidatus Limnocylindrales bacterium]
MATNFNNRALAVSQKVYGWLLRAYPPAHREEYGPAMAQLFRDQCRDAWNEAQGWGLFKLWLRVLPDLVSTSIRERLDALNERKSMNEKIASLSHDRTTPTAIFIRVFIAVFLITVIAATLITFILPESYASTARIKLESDAPPVAGQPSYDPYFIQTEFEIIQSQLVLNPVIDKLKLNVDWGKKYFAGQTLTASQTLEILKQRLQLAPVKNTKLIAITVYSDDRQEAAQIANAIAEAYRDYRVNSHAELKAKGIVVLQQQYKIQEEQIHTAQSDVESLRQQLKSAGDVAASQSPQEQPYWDKKRDLSQLLDLHKSLFSKIEAEQLDAQMPQTALVQIIDQAELGRAPVRPNKTLNIVIGAVAGGFLGLMAGAASALVSFKFGNRARKNAAAT